ncbi:ABC transporter permease [Avibacterium avium]|uniref:ABC transporter permease n=1 Tax=Avibacterium avium TaxID=751 RepID=UPI003BF7A0F3
MSKLLSSFYYFLYDIYVNKRLLWDLAKNDFKSRYTGNYLGILWAFVQPTFTIVIFWFVFDIGFKSIPVDNFPFILWLMSGIIPWFFFADCLQSGTQSILSNNFLVKQVVFKVHLLPIVQLISAFKIHLFFVVFMMIMFCLYGHYPNIYWLQIPYYTFCILALAIGITWITSSVVIFFRDLGQVVAMAIQFGFWLTPIFWSLKIIPDKYAIFFKLNPAFYVVEGYRDSLIYHVFFWDKIGWTLYFWIIVVIIFLLGIFVFKKLRPHFADVL